jgi:hypothetical protein
VASRAILNTSKEVYTMKNEDLRRQLYDLRQQSRERYLQFMGVDVGKLRELESDINAQYEDLAVAVQDTLKDLGRMKPAYTRNH